MNCEDCLAYLSMSIISLLMELFKNNDISFETLKSEANLKVQMLEEYLESDSTAMQEQREIVGHFLEQYYCLVEPESCTCK